MGDRYIDYILYRKNRKRRHTKNGRMAQAKLSLTKAKLPKAASLLAKRTRGTNRGGGFEMSKKRVDLAACTRPLTEHDINDSHLDAENVIHCERISPFCLEANFHIDKSYPVKEAEGAYNDVFLMYACNTPVAIRVSKRHVDIDKIDNYMEECRILARLSSVDITPKLYWFGMIYKGVHSHHFAMIMERGEDVSELLRSSHKVTRTGFITILSNIYSVCDNFVEYEKKLNYDFKPRNLIAREERNGEYTILMIDIDVIALGPPSELHMVNIKWPNSLELAKYIMRLFCLLHLYAFVFGKYEYGDKTTAEYERCKIIVGEIMAILKIKLNDRYNVGRYIYEIIYDTNGEKSNPYKLIQYYNHYFNSSMTGKMKGEIKKLVNTAAAPLISRELMEFYIPENPGSIETPADYV